MKIIKNKEQIERTLRRETRPGGSRDNDNILIANIWYRESKKLLKPHEFEQIQAFLRLIANGDLSNAETIRRTRAKLQQENPELRGEAYRRRHTNEEKEAREDLRAFEVHEQRGQISLGI